MAVRKWNNDGIPTSNEDIFWEDLMQLKDQTVEALLTQQSLTTSLIDASRDLINKDEKLKNIVVGILKSYKDIADIIKKNMDNHITMSEDGKVSNYKMGKISMGDDGYMDFLRITSDYINAQEQLAHISCTSYSELVSQIAIQDPDIVSQKDADEFIKVRNEGVETIKNAMKGLSNVGKQRKPKPAKSTTRTTKSSTGTKARSQTERRKGNSSSKGK